MEKEDGRPKLERQVSCRSPMTVSSIQSSERVGAPPLLFEPRPVRVETLSSVLFRSSDDRLDWEPARLGLKLSLSAEIDPYNKPATIEELRRDPESQIAFSGNTLYVVRSPAGSATQSHPNLGYEFLKYEMPHFSAAAHVHIREFPPDVINHVSGKEESDDSFTIGWITACNYSEIKCVYDFNDERGFVLIRPGPLHQTDSAVCDSTIANDQLQPWLNAGAVGHFSKSKRHGSIALKDAKYCSPEIAFRRHEGKLSRVRHNQGYTTWLVAYNTKLDQHCKDPPYKVLLAFKWTCDLELSVDMEKPLGQRARIVGRNRQGVHKVALVRYLHPLPYNVILRPYTLASLQSPHWIRCEDLYVPHDASRQWHRNHSWVLKKYQSSDEDNVYMYTNAETNDNFLYSVDKVTDFVQHCVECKLADIDGKPALTATAVPFVEFNVHLTVINDWKEHTEWEIGWIQACFFLNSTASYEGGETSKEYLLDAKGEMLRDSRLRFTKAIWHCLESKHLVRGGGAEGKTKLSLIHRSPLKRAYALFNVAENNTKNFLLDLQEDAGFYTWLVARNTRTGDFLVILTFRWSIHIAVQVRPSLRLVQDGTKQQQPEVFFHDEIPIPPCVLYCVSRLSEGTARFFDSPRCRSSRAGSGSTTLRETANNGRPVSAGEAPSAQLKNVIRIHPDANVSLSHCDVDEHQEPKTVSASKPEQNLRPVDAGCLSPARSNNVKGVYPDANVSQWHTHVDEHHSDVIVSSSPLEQSGYPVDTSHVSAARNNNVTWLQPDTNVSRSHTHVNEYQGNIIVSPSSPKQSRRPADAFHASPARGNNVIRIHPEADFSLHRHVNERREDITCSPSSPKQIRRPVDEGHESPARSNIFLRMHPDKDVSLPHFKADESWGSKIIAPPLSRYTSPGYTNAAYTGPDSRPIANQGISAQLPKPPQAHLSQMMDQVGRTEHDISGDLGLTSTSMPLGAYSGLGEIGQSSHRQRITPQPNLPPTARNTTNQGESPEHAKPRIISPSTLRTIAAGIGSGRIYPAPPVQPRQQAYNRRASAELNASRVMGITSQSPPRRLSDPYASPHLQPQQPILLPSSFSPPRSAELPSFFSPSPFVSSQSYQSPTIRRAGLNKTVINIHQDDPVRQDQPSSPLRTVNQRDRSAAGTDTAVQFRTLPLGYLPVASLGENVVAPLGPMITTALSPVLDASLRVTGRKSIP